MTARPGFGLPHDGFRSLLARRAPVAAEEVSWAGGAVRLGLAVHLTPLDEVPAELVTSARCIVHVGDEVLLCTNADGTRNVVPGGRLEPGETPRDAAVREVHEETGWRIDAAALEEIGWWHFRYRTPVDDAFREYPHPDFVHAVLTAPALERDGAQGGGWTDTEGYVVDARPVPVDEALAALGGQSTERVLLERATGRR